MQALEYDESSTAVSAFSALLFLNHTSPTETYTLSLHDALPISCGWPPRRCATTSSPARSRRSRDRKSTRLNSSHTVISYAVFCLKKKSLNSRPNMRRAIPLSQTSPIHQHNFRPELLSRFMQLVN